MNIDVNHNACSNNRSLLYFGCFLAENILSVNLKAHFPRWGIEYYGILPVMNRFILMHYLKLTSCIELKNQKTKALNESFVMENSPKMRIFHLISFLPEWEKFRLNVLAVF